jgi:hypothetical protein
MTTLRSKRGKIFPFRLKILTDSGAVAAFIRKMSLDVERDSDSIRIEMQLVLAGEDSAARVSSAMPIWDVYFNDTEVVPSERHLAETMRKARVATLEERVADEMMGNWGGRIRVESLQIDKNHIPQVGLVGTVGTRHIFFGMEGDSLVKVIGHFGGKE